MSFSIEIFIFLFMTIILTIRCIDLTKTIWYLQYKFHLVIKNSLIIVITNLLLIKNVKIPSTQDSVVKKYNLSNVKFSDYFAGPMPTFPGIDEAQKVFDYQGIWIDWTLKYFSTFLILTNFPFGVVLRIHKIILIAIQPCLSLLQ